MNNTHIHILVAMDDEALPLTSLLSADNPLRNRFSMTVCGVGKVNAARAAQIMANDIKNKTGESHVVAIVGTGAGLADDLEVGELVIVSKALQHDMDVTPLGFKRGQIPFAETWEWTTDSNWAISVAAQAESLGFKNRFGKILTGDRFVARGHEADDLRTNLHGVVLDMETAAVAQVLHAENIPWFGVRVITDGANGSSPIDFAANLRQGMEKISKLLKAVGDACTDSDPT